MSEATTQGPARLLGWPEVQRMVSASRSTIWRWEQQGRFPRRRQIGPTRVAWVEAEVQEFIATRPVVGADDGSDDSSEGS